MTHARHAHGESPTDGTECPEAPAIDERTLALLAARTVNGVVVTDALGRVVWVNDGFVRLTGYAPDEVLGKTPGSVLQGPDSDQAVVTLMRDRIRARQDFKVEIVNYRKGGEKYWVEVEAQPIIAADGRVCGFMAIQSDITPRKRTERRLAVQYAIARVLAEADSFESALGLGLPTAGQALGWQFGAVWAVSPDRRTLALSHTWVSPGHRFDHFETATRSLEFAPGQGLPGRVWSAGESEWVTDVSTDPRFVRRAEAALDGLHSGVFLPVRAG